MTYTACVESAGGNPDLIAQCSAQRTACYDSVDDTFVGCANVCTDWPNAGCVQLVCGPNFGVAHARCSDGYWACLMGGTQQAVCAAIRDACLANALIAYEACLLAVCTTPCTVSIAPTTWGAVKSLYRDQ